MSEYSEHELLRDIQAHNEEALIFLHQQYANLVYTVAYRILADSMLAEEVTQDTFMRLWKKADEVDLQKGRLLPWLLMVARCLALDAFRHRKRREPQAGMIFMDENPVLWENALTESGSETLRRNLELALGEVPCEQRELIVLTYYYRLSHQDIADMMSIPLGTVKTRIRSGMEKLRVAWQTPLELA